MKKVFFGVLAVAFMASCGSKTGPETVVTEYLNALKAKEWDKAAALGNEDTKAKIEGIKSFGGDAGITEVKDIACTTTDSTAECSFCCMQNATSSKILLVKEGDKWIVNDKKETPDAGELMDSTINEMNSALDSLSTEMDAAAGSTETATETATETPAAN